MNFIYNLKTMLHEGLYKNVLFVINQSFMKS